MTVSKLDQLGKDKLLIATVGLPYSGKSTWAKEQGIPVVEPDCIRMALHGQRFVPEMEPYVWAIAKTMVKALFIAGHDKVILSSTCTTMRHKQEWMSKEWSTAFKLFPVRKDECVDRAGAWGDKTILPVIDRMWAQLDFDLPQGAGLFNG